MPRTYVAVVDVGHGNSAIVVDEKVSVVDTGPGSSVLEFLLESNLSTIDSIFISHSDSDHVAGLIGLLSASSLTIDSVFANSDSTKDSQIWDDLAFAIDQSIKANRLRNFDGLNAGSSVRHKNGGIDICILAPGAYLGMKGVGSADREGRRLTSNTLSAVIRLERNGTGLILFAGDLDSTGLDHLQSSGVDSTSIIAVFPHHGGRPGSSDMQGFADEFCRLVAPQIVIFSNGRGMHGNPRREIIDGVRRNRTNIRIMCTQLSTNCAAAIPSADPNHLSTSYADGKRNKHCCAGTIIIDLDSGDPVITPTAQAHQQFVTLSAPTALCR